ncbi:MAG: abfA [Verrucomicrobiales bacterium]|nr:abfA [Verrucomicrobiales bacterium]
MNSRLLFVVGLCFFWGANFFAAGAEIPQLTVTNQTTNMVISWPGAAQWVLEESSNLQTSVPWTLVSQDLYQSNASSRFVSVVTNVGSRFFRLRKIGLSVPGLNGYWGLDEGAGQISEDGSTFGSALLFTNASWGAGRIGPGALRFTGSPAGPNASRAWVSNNSTVLPPRGNSFSLSLWLNPDALPIGWSGIAGNNSNGTNGWHIALNNAGPGTNFFVFTSAGLSTSLSITGRFLLLPGQWHQLTVTHDGTEGSIYLDSALLARGSGPLATHNGPIYFGGGIANFDSFLGRIDDLRLYTNSLPHEQVSLTGCWHFDETNGQTCMDSSIQGHSAILSNSSARISGHGGLGIDLSKSQVTIGNQDYAILPPNGGSFSISFWLLPTAISPGWSGLMKLGEGPLGGFELTFITDDSGKPSLHFASTNVGGTLDLLSPVPLTTGIWTKFDLTFNGGIATLYANGKQLKSINGAIRGTKSPLLIGTLPTLPPFNGVFDDLKIYSRERGASEIGPIANTMWETVMLNSSTNMQLQGDGPIGKPLTYTIEPVLAPTNVSVS